MKSIKAPRFAHTSNAKRGMGDTQGQAIRQKVGRVRHSYLYPRVQEENLRNKRITLA